jgi:hypothetical protein
LQSYRENDADNDRWRDFELRPGDIVISSPSKSGTTWTQLLVALLVFDGPEFPAPLSRLSPWMDQLTRPRSEVHELLGRQTHRRFIKTHTPLDGLPERADIRYVCVGRDPRDAAVSMIHHRSNIRRERFREILASTKAADGLPTPEPETEPSSRPAQTVSEYFDRFIDQPWREGDPPSWSLAFLAHHYRSYWERRDRSEVLGIHFADLQHDLAAQISRLARFLGDPIDLARARALAAEAHIDRARGRALDLAPEAHMGFWRDPAAFFRNGASGEWRKAMSPQQQRRYLRRAAELFEPELSDWVHRGSG